MCIHAVCEFSSVLDERLQRSRISITARSVDSYMWNATNIYNYVIAPGDPLQKFVIAHSDRMCCVEWVRHSNNKIIAANRYYSGINVNCIQDQPI